MNLILGISIPLANEQKNFLKVPKRLQCQNDFKPLRCQGVFNPLTLQSNAVQPLYLQSNLVDKILKLNDAYIKNNKSGPLKQQFSVNPKEPSLFGLRNKLCKKISEFVCSVPCPASLNPKKNAHVKTLVVARPYFGFCQSCGKYICSIPPCIRSAMVFHDQPFAGLRPTDKGTVKPSEIFSLLGLEAQNPSDSPLEQLGLNPVF